MPPDEYVIAARRNLSTVREWRDPNKRRACQTAWCIARAYGQTLDDVLVTAPDGTVVKHLAYREGRWYSAESGK